LREEIDETLLMWKMVIARWSYLLDIYEIGIMDGMEMVSREKEKGMIYI